MDCKRCRTEPGLDFDVAMAFQPIVDMANKTIFAFEGLVRGLDGEGAGYVLSKVDEASRYSFDQKCRTTAIHTAAELGLAEAAPDAYLSINFLPNAVYEPRACIRQTLSAAMETGFPVNRILFEFTENERLDTAHILNILRTYRALGFATAIDDFGAGYAGLSLLADFQPDFVKLDMGLIRGIDADRARQTLVRHVLSMAQDLGIRAICEGIETVGEYETLRDLGVDLMQGYLFAKPGFKSLPTIEWPGASAGERVAS